MLIYIKSTKQQSDTGLLKALKQQFISPKVQQFLLMYKQYFFMIINCWITKPWTKQHNFLPFISISIKWIIFFKSWLDYTTNLCITQSFRFNSSSKPWLWHHLYSCCYLTLNFTLSVFVQKKKKKKYFYNLNFYNALLLQFVADCLKIEELVEVSLHISAPCIVLCGTSGTH